MKKVIAFTLALMILLAMTSCGKKQEETLNTEPVPETTEAPVETTEPTIPAL